MSLRSLNLDGNNYINVCFRLKSFKCGSENIRVLDKVVWNLMTWKFAL